MAEVYDGRDERLERQVAIKVLRPDMAVHPEVRDRFETEARSAAKLIHPNVVGVFDTGEDGGDPYLVMERLPGETLADRLQAGRPDTGWVLRMAGDVLGALGAAHAAGIIHRDIKPANILIGADDCAKVADFGIAKSVEMVGDLTATGLLLGTPAYLAPERVDGRPATPQSDLYAVGVVLYEALSGTRPFKGDSAVAIAYNVQHSAPPPLATVCPAVPASVANAIDRAMAKDPSARPASALEMARELGVDGASATVVTPTPGGDTVTLDRATVAAAPVPWWQARRTRIAAIVLGAVLLVAMGIAAIAATRDGAGGTAAAKSTSTTTASTSSSTTVRHGDAALASQIDALASQVGDAGEQGPALADRLSALAAKVRTGDSAAGADATRLLADASAWNQAGEDILTTDAYRATVAVVSKVPGVTVASTTTTVVARHKRKGHD